MFLEMMERPKHKEILLSRSRYNVDDGRMNSPERSRCTAAFPQTYVAVKKSYKKSRDIATAEKIPRRGELKRNCGAHKLNQETESKMMIMALDEEDNDDLSDICHAANQLLIDDKIACERKNFSDHQRILEWLHSSADVFNENHLMFNRSNIIHNFGDELKESMKSNEKPIHFRSSERNLDHLIFLRSNETQSPSSKTDLLRVVASAADPPLKSPMTRGSPLHVSAPDKKSKEHFDSDPGVVYPWNQSVLLGGQSQIVTGSGSSRDVTEGTIVSIHVPFYGTYSDDEEGCTNDKEPETNGCQASPVSCCNLLNVSEELRMRIASNDKEKEKQWKDAIAGIAGIDGKLDEGFSRNHRMTIESRIQDHKKQSAMTPIDRMSLPMTSTPKKPHSSRENNKTRESREDRLICTTSLESALTSKVRKYEENCNSFQLICENPEEFNVRINSSKVEMRNETGREKYDEKHGAMQRLNRESGFDMKRTHEKKFIEKKAKEERDSRRWSKKSDAGKEKSDKDMNSCAKVLFKQPPELIGLEDDGVEFVRNHSKCGKSDDESNQGSGMEKVRYGNHASKEPNFTRKEGVLRIRIRRTEEQKLDDDQYECDIEESQSNKVSNLHSEKYRSKTKSRPPREYSKNGREDHQKKERGDRFSGRNHRFPYSIDCGCCGPVSTETFTKIRQSERCQDLNHNTQKSEANRDEGQRSESSGIGDSSTDISTCTAAAATTNNGTDEVGLAEACVSYDSPQIRRVSELSSFFDQLNTINITQGELNVTEKSVQPNVDLAEEKAPPNNKAPGNARTKADSMSMDFDILLPPPLAFRDITSDKSSSIFSEPLSGRNSKSTSPPKTPPKPRDSSSRSLGSSQASDDNAKHASQQMSSKSVMMHPRVESKLTMVMVDCTNDLDARSTDLSNHCSYKAPEMEQSNGVNFISIAEKIRQDYVSQLSTSSSSRGREDLEENVYQSFMEDSISIDSNTAFCASASTGIFDLLTESDKQITDKDNRLSAAVGINTQPMKISDDDFLHTSVYSWGTEDVSRWLVSQQLSEQCENFVRHSIDGPKLIKLDRNSLIALGMIDVMQRMRFERMLRRAMNSDQAL